MRDRGRSPPVIMEGGLIVDRRPPLKKRGLGWVSVSVKDSHNVLPKEMTSHTMGVTFLCETESAVGIGIGEVGDV